MIYLNSLNPDSYTVLGIVKKIVESHKGTIECDSDLIKTVFKITLPKFNSI
jgi:signal transduction histidine kinase